ncbi:hypothetical protein [Yoonia sp. BS5-3]|uniref:Uncharacterized protein n=1 Tax=Yoonia phaeophyticola TaxID=3137369 RepID=A0ABZ2V4L3_9RHOB
MGAIRISILSFILLALVQATTARAAPSHENQLHYFATCTGRLSALMEHQWMFDGAASEQTKRQRASMIDLVTAIAKPDEGRQVLHWRLMAKHAQSVLLTRATFNDDPADAAWAEARAVSLTQECAGLLTS